MALYYCRHCGKRVERPNETRTFIASYCEETGKQVRLRRLGKAGMLTISLVILVSLLAVLSILASLSLWTLWGLLYG